jgi:hypothetical protein
MGCVDRRPPSNEAGETDPASLRKERSPSQSSECRRAAFDHDEAAEGLPQVAEIRIPQSSDAGNEG